MFGCTTKPPLPAECQNLSWEEQDLCITKLAIEENNPDLCANASFNNYCIHDVAYSNNNWEACSKIGASASANKCYFSAAAKTQNSSYCSKMSVTYNGFQNSEETQAKQKECQDNYQKFNSYGSLTCGRGIDSFTCCNDSETKKWNSGCN